MSIRIAFDWENPQAAKGPELRATWARLTITINDVPITQVQDYAVRSVRDGIYVPLYPLAEWLAMHWWFVFHEYETPGLWREAEESYARRHNLRYAREGFALPNLHICPMGPRICLAWKPVDMPAEKVRFLQEGTALFDTEVVREAFADFIRVVLKRLEFEGLANTLLEDEWKAIEAVDPEEREFCEASAALGLDPYSLMDEHREAIVQASETLPAGFASDFFSVANIHDLPKQVKTVINGLKQIKNLSGDLIPLKDLREKTAKIDPLQTPWEEGYVFARKLRKLLGREDDLIKNMQHVSTYLGVDEQDLKQAIISPHDQFRFFDALIDVNEHGSPGFLIEKRQEESRRFAFFRSLFEYLISESHAPALISATRSERQKRNRAFAAEFLAPAALLKGHMSGDVLYEEEIDELAAAFGVSPYVIRHQIENHRLARLIKD